MAVKIRLKRMGKIRAPFYRVVVMDSRTKRDGRAIEEIGKYHPTEEPSLIQIDSERAQYWLGNGAQPTEAVAALLKITGDWQKYKGEPGAEGTLKVKEPKTSKKELYEAAVAAAGKTTWRTARPPRRPQARREEGRARRRGARCRGSRRRGRRRRGPRGRGPPPAEAPAAEATDSREGLTVLEEALEHLVTGIVDHKDEVQVRRKDLRRGEVLEVRVHPEDLGRVIGRSGRTASALRTVMGALAGGRQVRIDIVDTDRER